MFDWLNKASEWFYIEITFRDKDKNEYKVYEVLEPDAETWTVSRTIKWIKDNYSNVIAEFPTVSMQFAFLEYDPNAPEE